MLVDNGSDLPAEIGVAHVAHAFRFKDGIGERIHVGRRRLHEPPVRSRRQAEAKPDAEVVEKLSDLAVKLAANHDAIIPDGQGAGTRPKLGIPAAGERDISVISGGSL